jgi:predicted Zn-dependent protease
MSARLSAPPVVVERAVAASRSDGCVVIVEDSRHANLRWASNTLTTNGVSHEQSVTVVAIVEQGEGASAGAVTRTLHSDDDIEALVRTAEDVARRSGPEESSRPLVAGPAAADFAEPPARSGIEVFGSLTGDLGEVLSAARDAPMLLFGYAEHTLVTTYLGTSTGVRHRHVQPSGHLTMTAKSLDHSASTWAARATQDFTDVSVDDVAAELRTKLGWSQRRVPLGPGRHPTILPPTSVADLAIYAYWEMAGLSAHEGRTVFADPGRGTRVGQQLMDPRVSLLSDPSHPGLGCADVVATAASSPFASVFDNGLPVQATSWIDHGVLRALVQTRHSAALTGLPVTPAVDNLVMSVDGGTGTVDDLVARTDRGVLLTSLWYIREVDPQTLLLTGLTRDGVFVVEAGEVVGVSTNFRFNDSPIDLLGRVRDAGSPTTAMSREWGEYFPRTVMPPLLVEDFHFSTVSDAL